MKPPRSVRSGTCRCLPCALACLLVVLTIDFDLTTVSSHAAEPRGEVLLREGLDLFHKGDLEGCIVRWQEAENLYRKSRQTNQQIQVTVHLASVYQEQGQHRLAERAADTALALAQRSGIGVSASLKNLLGKVCMSSRKFEQAERLFGEAEKQAEEEDDGALLASVLNNHGNLRARQRQFQEAGAYYTRALEWARKAGQSNLVAQALVNLGKAAVRVEDATKARQACEAATQELGRWEPTREKVVLMLSLVQTYRQLGQLDRLAGQQWLVRANETCQQACELAEGLGDDRSLCYGLGYRAELYTAAGQTEEASHLARQAVFYAQRAHAPDALYRWEWDSARSEMALGHRREALGAYRRAVQTLQSIRHDVVIGLAMGERSASFREAVGALFFELADVLLQEADVEADRQRTQQLLSEVRETLELLKSAELEDYFRDECVNIALSKVTAIEVITPKTAVLYVVPLPDRTELLLGLSEGLERFKLPVPELVLSATVREFRKKLEKRTTHEYRLPGRQLYEWLIAPIAGVLQSNQIETLVFVPDGALRLVPAGAFCHGDTFLIEEFAVAVTPGLRLMEPKSLPRSAVRILLGGISEARADYPPLPYVPHELQEIQQIYGGTLLLNRDFSTNKVSSQFEDDAYSIVHMASHGEFKGDSSQTFVLAYDGKLDLDQLERLIRPSKYRGQPVELLTLSACQTAAGDDRAALGLAGLAIKAGARSALATLWHVNDQASSELVAEFYFQLQNGRAGSKASALQNAQRKLIADGRYQHPGYWSPFLLIGDWL